MRSSETIFPLLMLFVIALLLGVAVEHDNAIIEQQKQRNMQVVESTLMRWPALFSKLDSDKDGLLSNDELRNAFLEHDFGDQSTEVVEFLWTHLNEIGHVTGKYRFGDDTCPEYKISKADLQALPATAKRLWGKQ